MDVSSISVAKALAIENASITEGYVDGAGNLVLKTKGGTEVNGGPISMLGAWPVDSVYIGLTPVSPAVLFGGGTWSRFAQGRVLVGLDEADTDFDTVLETRGAKTHVLTEAEMPSHEHGGTTGIQNADHYHTGSTTTGGAHTHVYQQNETEPNMTAGGANDVADNTYTSINTGGSGEHGHDLTTAGASASHGHPISTSGADAAHNNIQPSIVVYMWRRTA